MGHRADRYARHLYGWIGLAAYGPYRILGIAGALLILAAVVMASHSLPVAVALLVLGAAPLAVAAWWSIAAPIAGVLTLLAGGWALRGPPPDRGRPGHTVMG